MRLLSLPLPSLPLAGLLLSSCAAPAPSLSHDRPATSTAAAAPPPAPSVTLALDNDGTLFAPRESSTPRSDPAHAGHAHDDRAGVDDVYTCPMHPEVTSAAPGRCPHCGMNLVKKEAR